MISHISLLFRIRRQSSSWPINFSLSRSQVILIQQLALHWGFCSLSYDEMCEWRFILNFLRGVCFSLFVVFYIHFPSWAWENPKYTFVNCITIHSTPCRLKASHGYHNDDMFGDRGYVEVHMRVSKALTFTCYATVVRPGDSSQALLAKGRLWPSPSDDD